MLLSHKACVFKHYRRIAYRSLLSNYGNFNSSFIRSFSYHTDNYAEDENYYDPTLPSPQFARTSLTLPQSYSEEELDDIWTNSTEVVAPENSSQGSIWWNNTPSSGWSNTGFNSFNRPGSSFSFFGGMGPMFNP